MVSSHPLPCLVLLDAHAIIHRAYHALPDFVSSKGEPTGALYGLVTMLLRLFGDLKPDYVVACYDRPEKTLRRQVYDDYKAGRARADEALVVQLERSRALVHALGIPIYDAAGFEADDIIGTIVEDLGGERGLKIIIASGDMDTMQLVTADRVVVYTLKRGLSETVLYDEKRVEKRFGFGPALLPDYKGLAGDPSDNIVGVRGIGEKTATVLIQRFGGVEAIYKQLKKKGGEEKFQQAGVKERVINLLKTSEEEALFSKTLATIRRDAPIEFKLPGKRWQELIDLSAVENIFRELEFRTLGGRLKNLLAGLPAPDGEESPTPDIKGVSIPGVGDSATGAAPGDLRIALWLLNSELTHPEAKDILQFTGASNLIAAREKLLAELKERKLERVYREIELPLVPVIARAEARGIMIDKNCLKKLSVGYHRELDELEKKIHRLAGGAFNINSPKQLAEVVFDRLHLQVKGLRKTAGGTRSTRESELLKLRAVHPIIDEILAYRERQKLLSTYIDSIPPRLDKSGRLHTNLNQTGTVTGRMSSTDPNLQNIPASDGLGEPIRRAFVAAPGFKLAALDYAQVEMRVLALLSEDEELIRIFNSGEDVHTSVAKKVFGVNETGVTKEMRRRAKVINFGIIYGMGVNALRANLSAAGELVTREEAQKFYDQYFASFPKLKGYFENAITQARKFGYTETLFGRRRYFPGLRSQLPYVRAMNERMAMNAPLQGTAADIVKLAMIEVDEMLREEKLDDHVFLLLQVHDELLYEVKEQVVEKALSKIKEVMEHVVDGGVPFTVHASAAQNWGEAK